MEKSLFPHYFCHFNLELGYAEVHHDEHNDGTHDRNYGKLEKRVINQVGGALI